MIHSGENLIDGVPVDVERKRIRRINIRIKPDGRVSLSVPKWWATLREGESFLRSKWRWVVKTREAVLARVATARAPVTDEDRNALALLLRELNDQWALRLHEANVTWKIRAMKTLWGSCHIRKRHITYNADLAHVSRAMVEYVVVHELTHLQAHNHGPQFYRLMDERLPGWKELRHRLNKREFGASAGPVVPVPSKPSLLQAPADGVAPERGDSFASVATERDPPNTPESINAPVATERDPSRAPDPVKKGKLVQGELFPFLFGT